jgi:3-hydroxy-9,10-secoandrosta-1,3,5(10)-triene-9,17-dione monooxygenase
MNMHAPARMAEADAKRVAESLIPELRSRAILADEMRKVPAENIDLLKKSGLLQTIQAAACGGHELSMRAHVDVISTIARGCNATAWVLGVYQAHSWLLGHLGEQAQRDVYGNGGD